MNANAKKAARRLGIISLILPGLLLTAACGSQYDPGLIEAPQFTDEAGALARPWRFAHHATTDSYTLELKHGEAAIERVGEEPWAMLVQRLPDELMDSLAGQRLVLSMDIRAQLDNRGFRAPIEPTAIMVKMWQRPSAGSNRLLSEMVGHRRAPTARLDLPPEADIASWERHSLEFETPANLSRMEVAIMLSSGGRLEVRKPSLRPISP